MGNHVPFPGFNQVFENQPPEFWFNILTVRKEREREREGGGGMKYGILIGRHSALSICQQNGLP